MNTDTFFSALMTIAGFMMIMVNIIQIHHLIKVKDSSGLAVYSYFVICTALIFMGSYGVYFNLMEIYVPIFIQVFLVVIIIFLIFKYRKEENYGGVIVINEISSLENRMTPENSMVEICISPEPIEIIF